MTCPDERKETTGIGSFIVERVDGGSLQYALKLSAVCNLQAYIQMVGGVLEMKKVVRFIGWPRAPAYHPLPSPSSSMWHYRWRLQLFSLP